MNKLIFTSNNNVELNLLKKINIIPDSIIIPNINKAQLRQEDPRTYIKRIVTAKCENVIQQNNNDLILSTETIISRNRKIFSVYYNDLENIKQLLLFLSGKKIKVLTSYCFAKNGKIISQKTIETKIKLKHFKESDLKIYFNLLQNTKEIESINIFDQHNLEYLILEIQGNYSNILGIPIYYINNTYTSLK